MTQQTSIDVMEKAKAHEAVVSNAIAQKKDEDKGTVPGATRESLKADRSKPYTINLPFTKHDVTFPPFIGNRLYDASDFTARARLSVLKVLPAFVVNHSSNAIGVTQLVGEALYFKSSGVGKFVEEYQKGSWKVIFAPPTNIVKGVFKKSAFHVDTKQLLNPQYMGGEVKRFFDREEAAVVDLARDGKLSNRWSARSGFMGMSSMAIAAAFPDEKDDPKVTEKAAVMSANHPMQYVGYRLGRGLLFPVTAVTRIVESIFSPGKNHHIGDGKREFSGVGMTMTGLFSVLAGFRQPREKMVQEVGELGAKIMTKKWAYDLNKWQSLGGIITTFAGLQLLLSIDNQQGWTNYGKTQFARLAVLPMSIKERFPNKDGWGDPNAKFYFAAQGVFQGKNVVASMIGGAQKLQDGTIIDQKKIRKLAKEKAQEVKVERLIHKADAIIEKADETLHDSDVPTTKISRAVDIERAMPERYEAQEQATMATV